MKILFVSMVSLKNNTSATIRNNGLLKGLVKLGHSIDVLTLKPNEVNISYDKTISIDIDNLIDNIYYIDNHPIYTLLMAKKSSHINKSKTVDVSTRSSIMKRLLNIFRNILKKIYDKTAIFDAQKINVKMVLNLEIDYSKYDIIISSSDPKSSHLIVKKIYTKNKSCKAKWIQYWGDPMYNDITRKRDWKDILVKYHEINLISMASRVVYVSPLTLNKQKEIFPKYAFKMDYSNQACTDINANIKNKNAKKEERLKIGYFGAYNSKIRNIIPLYNYVKDKDFELNICGTSDIKLQDTNNVHVYGQLSHNETIKMERESDILVSICNIRGTQIPGKIYYLASYMKPLVIILDGEYREELRSYFSKLDRFILCENKEDSINDAIKIAVQQISNTNYAIPEQLTPEFTARKLLQES